jgi:hypothetical protein
MSLRRMSLWLAILVSIGGCGLVPEKQGNGTATVRLDGLVTAGRPVVLVVTVHNVDTIPMEYVSGGPGRFPPGQDFRVTLARDGGKSTVVDASNGQYTMGSMWGQTLLPGGSLEVPLALPPVEAGHYQVVVTGRRWKLTPGVLEFTVSTDPAARGTFDAALLRRVRSGDPVAIHVVEYWPTAAARRALLADLAAAEGDRSERALEVMHFNRSAIDEGKPMPENGDRRVPEDVEAAVVEAIHHLTESSHSDAKLAAALGDFTAMAKLDSAALALIPLIKHLPPGEDRRWVIWGVGESQAPEAKAALYGWLQDDDVWTRYGAAWTLAWQHDKVALPTLEELAKKHEARPDEVFMDLSLFPEVPEAMATLKEQAKDPVYGADAKRALAYAKRTMAEMPH